MKALESRWRHGWHGSTGSAGSQEVGRHQGGLMLGHLVLSLKLKGSLKEGRGWTSWTWKFPAGGGGMEQHPALLVTVVMLTLLAKMRVMVVLLMADLLRAAGRRVGSQALLVGEFHSTMRTTDADPVAGRLLLLMACHLFLVHETIIG